MATETLISPGVLLQETDKTLITPAIDPSGIAIIGPSVKGPVEIPTQINSFQEYKNIFGTTFSSGSQAYEYFTSLTVKNYFQNGGSSALVVRVVSSSDSWGAASNTHISSSAKSSVQPFTLETLGKGTSFNSAQEGIEKISLLKPAGTALSSSFFHTTAHSGRLITITNGVGQQFFLAFTGSNAVGQTVDPTDATGSGTFVGVDITANALGVRLDGIVGVLTASTALTGAFDSIPLVEFDPVNSTLSSGIVAYKSTVDAVSANLDVRTEISSAIASDTASVTATQEGGEFNNGGLRGGDVDNLRWEISNVNNAAGTFAVIIRRGDDTRSRPIVLETFTNVSLDPLSTNYIARAIGDQQQVVNSTSDGIEVEGEFPNNSEFVRVSSVDGTTYQYLKNDGSVGTDGASTSYSASLPIASSGSFFGATGNNIPTHTAGNYGKDAGNGATDTGVNNIQGLKLADYTTAITILKNKEEFKFKTLVVPGLNNQHHSTTLNTIVENTEVRGDNFFILDLVPYNSTRTTVTNQAESLDTSFAGSYWPWTQVRSQELGRNVDCPASVVIPGVYAKSDSLAAPWFAPAGNTRGRVTNVVKVETKLNKEQRDDLYSSKVNPLATFAGQGIIVFGQKTLQQATSALDRINVRRLLLDIKDTVNGFARKLVFEQNTDATRSRFTRQVTPYLESLVQRQGLFAFQVKMDGQLNTSEVIDENKLVGQVFLQPTRTAEFIVLDFTLTPTGASFED